jgi:uncharacterized protein YkwD
VHGHVEQTDDREPTIVGDTGRHRGRRPMPAPLALGLTVTALLTAFGAGAALLPGSFTGSGAQAETPAAAIANLAPGAGAGADGAADPSAADPSTAAAADTATDPAADPSTAAPSSAPAPKPAVARKPVPKPKVTKPKVTKPKVTKPKPVKVGSGQVAQENEVIRITNLERAKKGCGKVKLNTKLRAAMRGHTQDMANKNYFSHDSQDGRSPWDRAKSAGYKTPIGENIAKGQRDAADVMRSWMDSPGHKANILNCDAKAIGVGLTYDGGTPIWGQLFGSV